MIKARVSVLVSVACIIGISTRLVGQSDPNYCNRLIHDKLAALNSKNSTAVTDGANSSDIDPRVTSVAFKAEEARLYSLNTASVYRKVATVTYDPNGSAGMYSLQMGAGHPIYSGNSLFTLTQRMNSASATMPGETVYVKLIAPPDHLEGLSESLKLQQNVQRDGVQVVPLSGTALEGETQRLLFTYPVKDLKASEISRITAGSKVGWFQSTLDFFVQTSQGLRRFQISVTARTSEILANMLDTLHGVFLQRAAGESRSVTEIVSAARVNLKKTHGHIADVDYQIRAELGQTFMVSLPQRSGIWG